MKTMQLWWNKWRAQSQSLNAKVRAGIRLVRLGDPSGFDVLFSQIGCYVPGFNPTEDIFSVLERHGSRDEWGQISILDICLMSRIE